MRIFSAKGWLSVLTEKEEDDYKSNKSKMSKKILNLSLREKHGSAEKLRCKALALQMMKKFHAMKFPASGIKFSLKKAASILSKKI